MTTHFSEIIVPVERTRRSLDALAVARVVAEPTGRTVHMVSVAPLEASKRERHSSLTGAADAYGFQSPKITILQENLKEKPVNSEASGLIDFIRQKPEALVCMSTHARGVIGDIVLGSVAGNVINNGRRPVVLIGPQFSADWDGPLETLVVCLDGSKLSEAILEPAARLAIDTGAKLLLVQALDPGSLQPGFAGDVNESGYLRSKAIEIDKQYGLQADWDVLHGKQPARAIAEYAAGFPGAMVAMTTHGYTGLNRINLGSVTLDVVHMIHCPVLTYKPTERMV